VVKGTSNSFDQPCKHAFITETEKSKRDELVLLLEELCVDLCLPCRLPAARALGGGGGWKWYKENLCFSPSNRASPGEKRIRKVTNLQSGPVVS